MKLSNPTSYTLELGTNGRLTLPASIRKQFGYSEGDLFILRVQEDGRFDLLAAKDVAVKTRGILKTLKPKKRDKGA